MLPRISAPRFFFVIALLGLGVLTPSSLVLAKEASTKPLDPFEERLREVYGEAAAARPEAPPKSAKSKKPISAPKPVEPTREELILAGRKKASYRVIFSGYQPGFEIAPYFIATTEGRLPPPPSLEILRGEWGDRASLRFSVLQAIVESQDSMVRAEIEDDATQKGARALLEMSLLRLRAMGPEQSALWMGSEGEVWQRVLQSLPFEEASHAAMVFASELRSLIWQEMLAKIKNAEVSQPLPWAAWADRANSVRLSWPIDRVLLVEARKSLPPAGLLIATHLANELQKSPHKSVSALRKNVRGGAMSRLDVLDAVWSETDVRRMEAEMDVLAEIRLRLALRRFQAHRGAEATNLDELIPLQLVDRIPKCFRTDKVWELSQLKTAN